MLSSIPMGLPSATSARTPGESPSNKTIAYVTFALTLAAVIWAAATAWQGLIDRVADLEKHQRYEHGAYTIPDAASVNLKGQ